MMRENLGGLFEEKKIRCRRVYIIPQSSIDTRTSSLSRAVPIHLHVNAAIYRVTFERASQSHSAPDYLHEL